MVKKKLLLIHNKYRDFGGEDVAVKNEIQLLEKYFIVEVLNFDNSIKKYLKQFVAFVLNKNAESGRIVSSIIYDFQPDIIYVHNSWFKASIEIFNVILKSNAKIIIKLHNFRYKCTNSYSLKKHLNEGVYCEACALDASKFKIFNKYFTSSYIKSILVIRYGKKYYEILKNTKVSILVLTNFHKSYLEKNGFSNIFVHPNYLDLVISEENDKHSEEDYILYAGRISEEKGVDELIDAFISSNLVNYTLKIVGEGPILEDLKIKHTNPRINFIDLLENSKVLSLIENSKAIVTATKLWEGQPTLLCEASLLGIPSIYPENGGIAEFFPANYKLSFEKNNYIDLINKLNLLLDDNYIEEIGKNNKKFIKSKLNEKNLIQNFYNIINE